MSINIIILSLLMAMCCVTNSKATDSTNNDQLKKFKQAIENQDLKILESINLIHEIKLTEEQKKELYNRAHQMFALSFLTNDYTGLQQSADVFNFLLKNKIINNDFIISQSDETFFTKYNFWPNESFFQGDFFIFSLILCLFFIFKTGSLYPLIFPVFSLVAFKFFHLLSFSFFNGMCIYLLLLLFAVVTLSYLTRGFNFKNKKSFICFSFMKTWLFSLIPCVLYIIASFYILPDFKIEFVSNIIFWKYKVFLPVLFFTTLISYVIHAYLGIYLTKNEIVVLSGSRFNRYIKSEIENIFSTNYTLNIKKKDNKTEDKFYILMTLDERAKLLNLKL